MKLGEADLEQSYFQSIPKAADKTVGWILLGLIVVCFFSIYVFGMVYVQNVSDKVVGDHSRASTEAVTEISDTIDPANR